MLPVPFTQALSCRLPARRCAAFNNASDQRGRKHQTTLCSKAGSRENEFGLERRELLLAAATLSSWSTLLRGPRSAWAEASGQLRPLSTPERAAVDSVLGPIISKAKAPAALRLAFHDSGTFSALDGTGGANASVQFELDRKENAGLKRPLGFVLQARAKLEGTYAAGLSCADLIALAGAAAVRVCGGPEIPVLVGRVDALGPDPEGRLPEETADAATLKQVFARAGFSARELVVLSGAHTLGGKGFGDPTKFDNFYFQALLRKPWLNKLDSMASMIGLPSDHVLPDDPECREAIEAFAADERLFQSEFQAAYLKLTSLGC